MKKSTIIKMEKLVGLSGATVTTKCSFVKSWLTEDRGAVVSVKWKKEGHLATLHITPVITIKRGQYATRDMDVVIGSRHFRNPLDAEQWAIDIFNRIYFVDTGIGGYMAYGVDFAPGSRHTPVVFKTVHGVMKVKTKSTDGVRAYAVDTRHRETVGGEGPYLRDYNPYHMGDLVKCVSIFDYSYELL